MSANILFFFSALGVFNGILLSLYFLIYAKPRHISNNFLGILFLVLSIRVGKSVFFYFNNYLSNIFIQVGITACVLIGPFLFFYIKSVLRPNSNTAGKWKYHILILGPLIVFLSIVYPYKLHKLLWVDYLMNLILLEWFIYMVFSGILLFPIVKKAYLKQESLLIIEVWILNIFFGNVMIWMGYFLADYTSYIVGAISFSLLIYFLVLLLFFSKKKQSVLYKKAQKYLEKKKDDKLASELILKLGNVLSKKEFFKKPNLTISDVAQELKIPSHSLSELINNSLNKSFPNLINEYRVEYAKMMILENDILTLEAIGNEAGFKSKSAFYRAFKKQLNMTPAAYKHSNNK